MITAPGAAPPAANPRPTTVTVAFWLQLGVAAALVAFAVLNVVEAVVYDGLIDRAAELTRADPEDVSAERLYNVEWAVMTGVPAVAVLALFAATAFPVRSGSNVARILTCVGAGFPLLCGVLCGGAGTLMMLPPFAFDEPMPPEEDPFWPEDSPFYESLYDLQSTGLDSWLSMVLPALLVVVFMLSVAVAVLLLVPPSNRYYRPPLPPRPAPGYPFSYPVPPGYVLVPIMPMRPGSPIPGPASPPDEPTTDT